MIAAVTEAITIADMCRGANETRITSKANSIPAMGALNDAPMPAPAPAATRERTSSSPTWNLREIHDPMAAPTWTIGPSLPADPPNPMVKAVVTILSGATRPLM